MNTLQSIIQQQVLKQINKQKVEPLESIYITYSSATKSKVEDVQARKIMQGIQSVHLQKQQSEGQIMKEQKDNVSMSENNSNLNKAGPQKGRFLVRREYHKYQHSVEEDGKRVKAKDIWQRRKEYDQKVRQFHLPKIKEYSRFQINNHSKQQSGQNTAELQFSDVFKEELDEDFLQEYNERYYKKQLLLWNKKQRQFDLLNDEYQD